MGGRNCSIKPYIHKLMLVALWGDTHGYKGFHVALFTRIYFLNWCYSLGGLEAVTIRKAYSKHKDVLIFQKTL